MKWNLPKGTFSSLIDYYCTFGLNKYGCIGIKVWLLFQEAVPRRTSIRTYFSDKVHSIKYIPVKTVAAIGIYPGLLQLRKHKQIQKDKEKKDFFLNDSYKIFFQKDFIYQPVLNSIFSFNKIFFSNCFAQSNSNLICNDFTYIQ